VLGLGWLLIVDDGHPGKQVPATAHVGASAVATALRGAA
jgi:hypothetical protein